MNYLWSWIPASAQSAAAPVQESKQLNEAQLNELHAKWVNMQTAHTAEAEGLMAKLVAENQELQEKLDACTRELKDVKAGRKEDEVALKQAQGAIEALGGGKIQTVAILDFELDLFLPNIFHSYGGGNEAYRALHRKMVESLPNEAKSKVGQFLAYVFWTRNPPFMKQLIAEGVVSSIRELDDFLNGFNQAHPLFMFIASDTPRELALQRQRALATVYARNPVCQRLILGRWALDLPLAEMISPSKGAEKPKFPDKIRFAEPFVGFYLAPELMRRQPQIIEMGGILRKYPLGSGGSSREVRQIDYNRPLWAQDPPICLDHYLAKSRCSDERCVFSHAYSLPREVLDALRYELSRTPCPLILAGSECLDGPRCFFSHTCPKEYCDGRDCPFKAPGMHPHYYPAAPPPPPPIARSPTCEAKQRFPAPTLPSAHRPPSTKTALEQLLAAGSASPRPINLSSRAPPMAASRVQSPSTKQSAAPSQAPGPSIPGSFLPPSPSKRNIPFSPLNSVRSTAPPSHPSRPSPAQPEPLAAESSFTPLPARHPLSPVSLRYLEHEAQMLHMSDAELDALLAKTRAEEAEYERGLQEDPFFAQDIDSEAHVHAGGTGQSLFGEEQSAAGESVLGEGWTSGSAQRAFEAAMAERKSDGVV
ncbi:hypothetical protein JCM21900_002224 [Sporobolomyces salmonicolor]